MNWNALQKISRNDLAYAGVGRAYWDSDLFLLPYNEKTHKTIKLLHKYIFNLEKMLLNGIGLLICSGNGTGKTSTAVSIIKIVLAYGGACRYVDIHTLALKTSQNLLYDKVEISNDLYVIDNISVLNEIEKRALEYVTRQRRDLNKSTILIVNGFVEDLPSQIISIVEDRFLKLYMDNFEFPKLIDKILTEIS